MRFQLLGPVEARLDDGSPVALGRRRERALLGLLLLQVRAVVPVDTLIELLWDRTTPTTATGQLRANVSRLRRCLDPDGNGRDGIRIVTRRAGYLVDVDPQCVDAHRFSALVDRARECTDLTARLAVVEEALDLWRGPLMADAVDDRVRHRIGLKWEELWLSAVELRADAQLALARPAAVVSALVDVVARHPLRERLVGLLMQALADDGRPAEALVLYNRHRLRLADELGVDPDQELQRIYHSMLRFDADGTPPEPAAQPVPAHPMPAQLPSPPIGFAGREAELARLDGVLAPAQYPATEKAVDNPPGAGGGMVVVAISGMAGVGKTTIAVHWAHRVAASYPDGQLYANLHGFDPNEDTEPVEVLRDFLQALGVAADAVPASLQARSGLYRTLLADRRMLVLLDNARSADQVYPLLPHSTGSLVIATSRHQLTGLVMDGAHQVNVGLLSVAEATLLLAGRIDALRMADEPEAVASVLSRCGGLPLALAIVAARAVSRSEFPLSVLTAELDENSNPLDALDGGDAATSLRDVFSWSYRTLRPAAARLFRLLGLHSGPDIDVVAVASLYGQPVPDVRPLLAELCRAHLLTEHRPRRYVFHDLIAAYAGELIRQSDGSDDYRAARLRLLDHYVHTACAADRLMYPHRDPVDTGMPADGVTVRPLADLDEATRWFDSERAALFRLIRLAEKYGFDKHVWQFAHAMTTYLDRSAEWKELPRLFTLALAATQRLGDIGWQARFHRYMGSAWSQLNRPAEAVESLGRAIELFRRSGDVEGEAHSEHTIAWVVNEQGRPGEALEHATRALELYRTAGHRLGAADALNMTGQHLIQLGDSAGALERCAEALTVFQEVRDRRSEADAWDNLALANRRLGRLAESLDAYAHVIAIRREIGEHFLLAKALEDQAEAQVNHGDVRAARSTLAEAVEVLESLRHEGAEAVRRRLDSLPDTAARGDDGGAPR